MGGVTTQTSKFGGVMKNVGGGILQGVGIGGFMAVGAAAAAMVGVVSKSIDLASDKVESIGKLRAVFGESSKDIETWAKGAAQNLRFSEASAIATTGTFGAMFTAMGATVPEAAKLSKNILTLGADLGSFNNIPTAEVLEKIRAGVTGEFEPLKAMGIVLNEATIQTAAFAQGIGDGVKPLTAAQKAQVVYAEIVRQTASAQGDAAKTSGTYAGQQQINAARMEDAMTRLGEVILPIASTIMPMLADALVGVVEGISVVVKGIGEFYQSTKGLWDILFGFAGFVAGALIQGLGQFADTVGQVFGVMQTVIGTVLDVIKFAIGGIIGAIRNVMEAAAQIPGPWQESAAAMAVTLDGMQAKVESFGQDTVTSMRDRGEEVPYALADPIAAGAGVVGAASTTGITDPMAAAAAAGKTRVVEIAGKTPTEMAAAMRDKRTAWQQSLDLLKSDLENKMSRGAEVAKLKAALAGDNITAGLKSKDPVVRAQTAATVGIIKDRLVELGSDATKWGSNAGANFAQGLYSSQTAVKRAAQYVAAAAAKNLEVRSPAKEGPLSRGGPEVWGERIGTSLADGLRSSVGDIRSSAVAAAGAAVPRFGSFGLPDAGTRSSALTVDGVPMTRTGLGAGAMAAPARPSMGSSRVWNGSVIVNINGDAPTGAAKARDLGRVIGDEVRLALTRGPGLFALDGSG